MQKICERSYAGLHVSCQDPTDYHADKRSRSDKTRNRYDTEGPRLALSDRIRALREEREGSLI